MIKEIFHNFHWVICGVYHTSIEDIYPRMLEQDEMFRLLVSKYAPTLSKKKKIASYMLEKREEVEELPLHEAITMKRDANKMQATYKPYLVQRYWDAWWNHNKFFHADNQSKNENKFVICLPPPNVTGYLHIGHALTVAVEDSIVRRKRQQGFETLFIPGTDHAGIATQTVVQKILMKQGKTKYDLGRQEFVKRVWQWKNKHGNGILNQLRRVGASVDWDRQVFTMDQQLSLAVSEGFAQLFEKNLIYRANRLINWSCALKTAISDIEVEYQQIEKSTMLSVPGYDKKVEFGVMIHFAYKLKEDPSQQLIVATTRIETMLGDVAVAVHPDDARYQSWVGKQLIHPFIPDRKIIVVADDFVERQFGTGAVKITPAHDPNDYLCGKKHNLEFINILTDDGLINSNGGKFEGKKRFECRKLIEEQLKKVDCWRDKLPHKMRLGTCQRSKDVIEPMIRPQWYVNCSQISKPMMEVVKNGELKIVPAEEEETWYRWIGNLRDWCISRQLWWGHRIPAYLAFKKGTQRPTGLETSDWVVAKNIQQAFQKAEQKLGVPKQQIELEQDPDVLDTWFSSGLFPFSPLKWPDTKHPDYQQFFPNHMLETGHDILFFWVARMVMMSLWLVGKLPFKQVLLHPLVCDSQGNKMSKSRGNVIDPLQIIDGTPLQSLIKKVRESNLPKGQQDKSVNNLKKQFENGINQCGSDALRFGLLAYMVQSRSINLNIKRVQSYREFCNKIWNSYKFSMPKFEYIKDFDASTINPIEQNFLDSWILCKLDRAVKNVNVNFDRYCLGEAAGSFHTFWYSELCDVYLEATKPLFQHGSDEQKSRTAVVLFMCIEVGLRLLHPMMPFITEQLYQKLPNYPSKCQTITKSPYPESFSPKFNGCEKHFQIIENKFAVISQFAASLRSIASSVNLPPHVRPQAYLITDQKIVMQQTDLLATLSRCLRINIMESQQKIPKGCGIAALRNSKIYLELGSHIDVNKQIERLNKKLTEINKFKQNLQKKINAPNREKIPEKVRKQQAEQMDKFNLEENNLRDGIAKIRQLE